MFPSGHLTELRVDVQLRPDDLDAELAKLHARLDSPSDPLHRIPSIPSRLPGLVFRYRKADGEHYVYVQDLVRRRLAGYTVFNRLVELDRKADRYLRGPHSRYGADYQRRGIATAVYEWALNSGLCLISGPRQSQGAHALWMTLSRRHPLGFVDLRDKVLRLLGDDVDPAMMGDLHTRMLLLGKGWTFDHLMADAGCRPAAEGRPVTPN
jgi:hypothetical protein